MDDIDKLIKLLGINVSYKDVVLLSITHKQSLNESGNTKKNIKLINYYNQVGKSVYKLLLKIFVYNNFSKHESSISIIYEASKQVFIDEFIAKYCIYNYLVCGKHLDKDKIINELIYQLLGCIYLNSSYSNLQRIFDDIFSVNKFSYIRDYISIINSYSKGKNINFIEMPMNGQSVFTYKLIIDDKIIISNGSSKKEAKQNCAKLFCEQYLSKDMLFKHSGIKLEEKNIDNKKDYYISEKMNFLLIKASKDLEIDKNEVLICATHSSISNEYNMIDNSNLRSLGADVEDLFLLEYVYNKSSDIQFADFMRLVSFLNNNNVIYNKLINKYNLKRIILCTKNVSEKTKALNKLYGDVCKSIFFIYWNSKKNLEIFYKNINIYDEVLEKVDIKYIDPITILQEILQGYKLNEVEYTYKEIEHEKFSCKIKLTIEDSFIISEKISDSKVSAQTECSIEILDFFYNEVDSLFYGKDINTVRYELVEKLIIYLINRHDEILSDFIFSKNFFYVNEALGGNADVFVNNISKFLLCVKNNFNEDSYILIYNYLKELFSKHFLFFNGTQLLIGALIIKIYEDILDGIINESNVNDLSFKTFDKYLSLKSREIVTNKLSENGSLIKFIDDPDEEMQQNAINNDINSLYYIKNPSKKIINYIIINDIPKKDIILKKVNVNSSDLIDIILNKYKNVFKESYKENIIIDNSINFEIHIKALFKFMNVNKFYIATGFSFDSGIILIENEIEDLLKRNGDFRIIAGNLQGYNLGQNSKNMDKKTAIKLNSLITKGCLLRTYDDKFYHGKMYYFESDSCCIVISGSTNLSKSAFHNNKELDIIYFYKYKSDNIFLDWFNKFWDGCSEIVNLEVSRFEEGQTFILNNEIDIDNKLVTVSKENIKNRIDEVPDETLRSRLLLWIEHNPSNIYDDIDVSNQKYIAIEYNERKMIVLESFIHGNSYFVFNNVSINKLLYFIKNKTKNEIFKMSGMDKRGYHIREMLNLETKIKSYFIY